MISSYHSHNCTFLLSNIRSQRCSPWVHRDPLQDGSPQTDVLLLQSLKRRGNQLIPVNPSCPEKIQDWQATPGGGAQTSRGLSGPATSSGSPRAKAQSAAAPPRLQRLCTVWSPFRQKAAGVSGWNSLTNLYKESVFVYLVLRSGP